RFRSHRRWATPASFVSRFLPALRAVVPVFAGVADVSAPRLVVPLALASAIWYGALIYLGGVVGRNWQQIMSIMDQASGWLLAIALVFIAAIAWWLIRTPRSGPQWRRSK